MPRFRPPPHNPIADPWLCRWQDVTDPNPWPHGEDDIVLVWMADHPPTPGDIIARRGDKVLRVTGPRLRRASDA